MEPGFHVVPALYGDQMSFFDFEPPHVVTGYIHSDWLRFAKFVPSETITGQFLRTVGTALLQSGKEAIQTVLA